MKIMEFWRFYSKYKSNLNSKIQNFRTFHLKLKVLKSFYHNKRNEKLDRILNHKDQTLKRIAFESLFENSTIEEMITNE